jgi:6,7-dimethyl-8-ribityllumazine synthase
MKQGSTKRSTDGRGMRIGIVVSRFHEDITGSLSAGAQRCLSRHGVRREDVQVVFCPGAFELPQVANLLCETGSYDAIICLGAVIRGETPHFEYVSSEAARGIQQVALHHLLPVTFGVLTTDTLEQAQDRAGGSQGNKGWDAAEAAVSMATLFRRVKRSSGRKRVD